MKEELIGMRESSSNNRWCMVTVALAINFALLISGVGIGLFISLNLQDTQDSLWEVGIQFGSTTTNL